MTTTAKRWSVWALLLAGLSMILWLLFRPVPLPYVSYDAQEREAH